MEITHPAPMVCDTAIAAWPPDAVGAAMTTAPASKYRPGFQPIREWPVFGLRPLELSALRFIDSEGPIALSDFRRQFKRGTPKARAETLHDLNRLGMIRIVVNADGHFWLQVTAKPDYEALERTMYSP
jgi:hypothetical protein